MEIADCKEIHGLLIAEKWIEAGNLVLSHLDQSQACKTKGQSLAICRGLLQHLLDEELYLHSATMLWGGDMFNAEPECVKRVFKALHENSKILFCGASSMGKSLAPSTRILMYDGSFKEAKYVVVGDELMGDDSMPRTVLTRTNGRGGMYRITPERGDPWVCNYAHILTLRVSSDKKCGSGSISKKWRKGDIIDIEIEEYIKLSNDKKNRLKQFSVGVELASREIPFDPYIYGCWLGDGTMTAPTLNTPPGPMSDRWKEYFTGIGYKVTEKSVGKCSRFYAGFNRKTEGSFSQFIKRTSVSGEKRIHPDFLNNSRENRLKLLAGLIDSDGWIQNKSGYQYCTKYKHLADQVTWLCRSLGFTGHQYAKIKKIKSIGFSGTYYHVSITGSGVTEIPTLEKRCCEPTGKKELLNTSFVIDKIPDGDYCSFSIDGNHRFLLADCTVTHNSYNAGVWMYLDWRRDPLYTSIKCVGISEDQVRKHVFSHLVKLHRASSIPMAEQVDVRDSDMWMGVKDAGLEFGITAIAYKQSQETSGGIKGYKAMPVRKIPHPKFGMLSRLRLLGDEGQNWPNGPFKDINTWLSQIDGPEKVKIAVAFNPENMSQLVVQMSEPPDGWNVDDMDRLYDWEAKSGWFVCRLDAARSENVIQKKMIYPGLQTYDGFISYLRAGGDNSANFSTFARGWPPMKGGASIIIPPSWPGESRGEAVFIENPTLIGAVDLAFMGQDTAQMAVGRWGLASGWRGIDGKFRPFMDRLNIANQRPRHVLQIDQIIPLDKHDNAVTMAEEIIGRCNELGITPEHLALDKTSIGFGTWSHLSKVWGDVLGISWNEAATEGKITADDKEGANKQCDGVMSEMWWAFRQWLNPTTKAILISQIIPTHPIHTQLTSRRYKSGKKGIRVEPKEEYKARNQHSPDEADALVMLVHLVRQFTKTLPGLVEQGNSINSKPDEDVVFRKVVEAGVADTDDSISLDPDEDA